MSYFCHCLYFTSAYITYKYLDCYTGYQEKSDIWINKEEMLKLRERFDKEHGYSPKELSKLPSFNKNCYIVEFQNYIRELLKKRVKEEENSDEILKVYRVQFSNI